MSEFPQPTPACNSPEIVYTKTVTGEFIDRLPDLQSAWRQGSMLDAAIIPPNRSAFTLGLTRVCAGGLFYRPSEFRRTGFEA